MWPATSSQKISSCQAALRRQLVLVRDVTQEAATLDATADALETARRDEFGEFMAARWPCQPESR
jgi:hypothetical protein